MWSISDILEAAKKDKPNTVLKGVLPIAETILGHLVINTLNVDNQRSDASRAYLALGTDKGLKLFIANFESKAIEERKVQIGAEDNLANVYGIAF